MATMVLVMLAGACMVGSRHGEPRAEKPVFAAPNYIWEDGMSRCYMLVGGYNRDTPAISCVRKGK